MQKLFRLINLTSCILLTLAACASQDSAKVKESATTDDKSNLAEQYGALSSAEIMDQIVGNTVTGSSVNSPGQRFIQYYDPSGAFPGMYMDGSAHWEGKWYVDVSLICWDMPGKEYDACKMIKLEGESVSYLNSDGSIWTTGTLLPGNPESF